MPRVTLSPIRARDRGFVAALAREAFEEYTRDASKAVAEMIARPGSITRIALASTRPVGFVVVNPVPQSAVAWVNAIAVEPPYRGRSVGRALLEGIERPAAARGLVELRLHTAPENLAALDLFLKCGYTIHTRHARFYARGQGAVELRRSLE